MNINYLKILITTSFLASPLFFPIWAVGGEDDDLSFLPPTSNETSEVLEATNPKEPLSIVKQKSVKLTFDNTLQSTQLKDTTEQTFQLPNSDQPDWNNLSRLNMQVDKALGKSVSLKIDQLVNAYTREGESFKSSKDLRLDIKEAYVSWQKSPTLFFDVGRINVKNGIATGFNPTDYFKAGTVLDRNTEDVSQLRDARLGALLAQGQKLWEGGSATLIASPKISYKTDNWTSDKNITGLNLHKSNDRTRTLIKLTHEISEGFSPELIYYNESGNHNIGLNFSKVLNKKMFAYMEWNIGKRRQLIDEAFLDARESHQLIPEISQKFDTDNGEKYLQQLAVGASYTSASNVTTKLEYHYNEAGLSSSEAQTWFDLGLNTKNPAVVGQLLSLRGLAQSKGEMLGQHRLFLYSTWQDVGMDDLDLTGLVMGDLNDSSHLLQVKMAYSPNKSTEVSLQAAKFNGDNDSFYGSLNQDNSVTAGFKYNF